MTTDPHDNDPANPYRSPQVQSTAGRPVSSGGRFAGCPQCGGTHAKKVSWTWWGGALGPAMLHHVRCLGCGTKYNGNTGKDNTTGIAIYIVVSSAIIFALFFWLIFAF